MKGEFDPYTEEILPPPESIGIEPEDAEPGIRRDFQLLEAELDLVERRTPDAPRRRSDQPVPRTDRAEDLMFRRSGLPTRKALAFPGVMEWNDDGAWDDAYGLDVAESF